MRVLDLLTRLHLWYAGNGSPVLARVFARVHPEIDSLKQDGDCWRLETKTETVFLLNPCQVFRVIGLGANMRDRVSKKYELPGFVAVESGDTVVDIGAFIGEFSRQAATVAERVIAVEPDDRNTNVLRRNLETAENASVLNRAVWHTTGTQSFNVAQDPSEGSILTVDHTDVEDTIELDAMRVDDIAAEFGLEEIDYLKVEAEGAEPEVLQGIGDLPVRKLAVECAPEREGETPVEEVSEWLLEHDYSVKRRNHIVFGKNSHNEC